MTNKEYLETYKLKLYSYTEKVKELVKTQVKKQDELYNKRLEYETIIEIQKEKTEDVKEVEQSIKVKLEPIVQKAIDMFFPDLIFKIDFIERANALELKMRLENMGNVINNISEFVGGGIQDILSFALQVTYLLLSKRRKILFLDQPFSNLNDESTSDRLSAISAQLVYDISHEFDLQIIIVKPKNGDFLCEIADKVIKITKRKKIINDKEYKVSVV